MSRSAMCSGFDGSCSVTICTPPQPTNTHHSGHQHYAACEPGPATSRQARTSLRVNGSPVMRSVQFFLLMFSSCTASIAYTLPDGLIATTCVLSLNSCPDQERGLVESGLEGSVQQLAVHQSTASAAGQAVSPTLKVTGQCHLSSLFLAMLRRRMSLVVSGWPVIGLFLC